MDVDINSGLAHHLRSQWSPTVEKAAGATPPWTGTLARISSVRCNEDVFVCPDDGVPIWQRWRMTKMRVDLLGTYPNRDRIVARKRNVEDPDRVGLGVILPQERSWAK